MKSSPQSLTQSVRQFQSPDTPSLRGPNVSFSPLQVLYSAVRTSIDRNDEKDGGCIFYQIRQGSVVRKVDSTIHRILFFLNFFKVSF